MPTPLTWQLEGEDTSLTTTVEGTGAAIQKWATESVAAADRVYAAMQRANGGSTGSSGGLGTVPAQAQAAADALGKVSASYTASGAAATIATQSQANLTVAMQAVVDAAIKGEGALGAQAAVLTTLSTAESQLAAATLALQRAEETRDAQLTKLSASEAKYQETIAKAVEANKSADTAEAGLARTQAARETAVARVTAAEENYVLALNRVQLAQEKAAASAAALVEKEAASAAAVTTQTAAVGRLAEGMDVYMPWVAQAVEKTGAWEQANARFDEGLTQVRADEEAATTKTKELGDASEQAGTKADRAGQGFDRLGQHIGNLLINQAVYASLNVLQQGLSAVNALLFEEPKAKESAVAVYTVELGNASEALTRFNAVQAESLKLGLPLKDLTTLDEHLSQIGVTGETAITRFGRTLPELRAQLEDLASLPGMDVTKVDEFFTRGTEGANRLVLSLQTAGIATRQELQNAGVQFSGFSNNIISAGDVTATAVLNIIQQKFSGLAAAQANTMAGIEVSTANAWQKIGQDLGADIFAQSESKAKELRDVLTDPAMDEAAKRLGKDLGGVADVLQTAEKTAIQLVALGPMLAALAQKNSGIDVSQFTPQNMLGAGWDFLTGNGASDRVERFRLNTKLLRDELVGTTANIEDDVVALAKLDVQTAATASGMSGLGAAMADAGTGEETAKQQADQLTAALSRARSAVSDLQAEEAGLVAPLQAALDANDQTAARVAQNYADQTAGLNQQMANVRAQASAASAAAQAQIEPAQADLQRLSDATAALKIKYDALIQPLKDQETALDRVYQKTQDLNRVNDTKHKLAVDRLLAVDLFSAEGRAAAARLPGDEASASDAQAQQTHDTAKAGLEDQVTGLERAQAKEAANIAAQQRGDQDHINAIQDADKIAQAGYKAQEASIQGNIDKVKAYADQSKEYYDGIKKDLQGQIESIQSRYKALEDGFTAEERTIERAQAVLKDGADAAMQVTQQNANLVLETIQATVAAINVFNGHDDSRPPPAVVPVSGPGAGPLVQSAPGRPGPGPDFGPINPPGRAAGGPVDTGWYTVGEQGPELLHAGGPGSVSANGGGMGLTVETVCPDCRKKEIGRWMADANNKGTLRRAVAGVL